MTKLKKIYPILPLRNTVPFPNQIIPIYIGREQSLKLISDVSKDMCKSYGVWGKKKFMGREYDGVHRTTFIINTM